MDRPWATRQEEECNNDSRTSIIHLHPDNGDDVGISSSNRRRVVVMCAQRYQWSQIQSRMSKLGHECRWGDDVKSVNNRAFSNRWEQPRTSTRHRHETPLFSISQVSSRHSFRFCLFAIIHSVHSKKEKRERKKNTLWRRTNATA